MVRKSSDIFKLFSTATSIFTLREAAKFLHVCPNTLRNWDNSGELKASLRFGKRGDRRYLKNDLVQYIEKNKEQSLKRKTHEKKTKTTKFKIKQNN